MGAEAGSLLICQLQISVRIHHAGDKTGKSRDGSKIHQKTSQGNLPCQAGMDQIAISQAVSQNRQ